MRIDLNILYLLPKNLRSFLVSPVATTFLKHFMLLDLVIKVAFNAEGGKGVVFPNISKDLPDYTVS